MAALLAGEAIERFDCFGGSCAVLVRGRGPAGSSREAATRAARRMREWHTQFSRFDPTSELCALNADARETVPVSPMMARFLGAALDAATRTGGLIDPTLVDEINAAGYKRSFAVPSLPVRDALCGAPTRGPAAPSPSSRWREINVDCDAQTVARPQGVRIDSGGIAKGLFADVLGSSLQGHPSFAVDAAGDLRFGGTHAAPRDVRVRSPFDDTVLHTFRLSRGAVATSGITKRSWRDDDGCAAHHILDPASGKPAFTGVLQVTALAPTALEAEALAKAALLSGPGPALSWLPHGGVVVGEDAVEIIEPRGNEL